MYKRQGYRPVRVSVHDHPAGLEALGCWPTACTGAVHALAVTTESVACERLLTAAVGALRLAVTTEFVAVSAAAISYVKIS